MKDDKGNKTFKNRISIPLETKQSCKILIVEDEIIVRKALYYIIEKEKQQYEIVGEVANGEEALKFLEHTMPHVIICDIVMPKMNGLELIKAVNLKYPDIFIIVFSGHDDFDYVKTAFQYGIVDYILKPELEPEHLLEKLNNIAKKLNLSTGWHSEKSDKNIAIIRTTFAKYNLLAFLPGEAYRKDQNKQNLLLQYITDYLQNTMHERLLYRKVLEEENAFIYLFGSHGGMDDIRKVEETLLQVKEDIQNVEVIIGKSFHNIDQLQTQISNILAYTNYSFFNPNLYYLNLELGQLYPSPSEFAQKEYLEKIKLLQILEAKDIIISYLESLKNTYAISEGLLKKQLENIFYNTIFELEDMEYSSTKMIERKLIYLSDIGHAKDIMELSSRINSIYEELHMFIKNERKKDDLYYRIIEYIQNNYSKAISLKGLAREFNISYSYLSAYLSSHMSQGINDYLNTIRIEKAKELLVYTEDTLANIAQSIGYTDQSYFGKVFKKQTNLSPLAYRKKMKSKNKEE